MTHYLQKEQEEEDDDLLALEQEVDLEESIIWLSINASAISTTCYNSQAWEEEDEYLFLFLFLFLEVAELADLLVVELNVLEDCDIVAENKSFN
jgi:hypothetical protein